MMYGKSGFTEVRFVGALDTDVIIRLQYDWICALLGGFPTGDRATSVTCIDHAPGPYYISIKPVLRQSEHTNVKEKNAKVALTTRTGRNVRKGTGNGAFLFSIQETL